MKKSKKNALPDGFSLEELQALLDQEVQRMNHVGVEDFDGLSPVQMDGMLEDPFGPASPLRLQPPEDWAQALPLRRALLALLEYFAGEKGEKLTPQGRLPRKLLLQIHALRPWGIDAFFDEREPRLEEDLPVAAMLFSAVLGDKLLSKTSGKMQLTRKGRAMLQAPAREQVVWLFQSMARRCRWSYLDFYPEMPELQHTCLFVLRLLLRHGQQARPVSFYAEAYLRAWPMLLELIPPSRFDTPPQEEFEHIFALRVFERWLLWFGWIALRWDGRFDERYEVWATPALARCWVTA